MSIFVQRPDIRKHEKNKHSHFFFLLFFGTETRWKIQLGGYLFCPLARNVDWLVQGPDSLCMRVRPPMCFLILLENQIPLSQRLIPHSAIPEQKSTTMPTSFLARLP